ncbi:MAG: hypothetical protein F6K24_17025 [Okeania sp. SIO2D1]|nr:hypothetical protein [Okeania sp. SIO2D1]
MKIFSSLGLMDMAQVSSPCFDRFFSFKGEALNLNSSVIKHSITILEEGDRRQETGDRREITWG